MNDKKSKIMHTKNWNYSKIFVFIIYVTDDDTDILATNIEVIDAYKYLGVFSKYILYQSKIQTVYFFF